MRPLPSLLALALLLGAHGAQAAPPGDVLADFLARRHLAMEQFEASLQDKANHATALVKSAMEMLGVAYRPGGNSATTGLDCSGLVQTVVQEAAGLQLPRTSASQAAATEKINKSELRPGDLVFFNTLRRAYSHVGIYIGEGKFIHAPRTGARVRIENMNLRYWKNRFNGARRVPMD